MWLSVPAATNCQQLFSLGATLCPPLLFMLRSYLAGACAGLRSATSIVQPPCCVQKAVSFASFTASGSYPYSPPLPQWWLSPGRTGYDTDVPIRAEPSSNKQFWNLFVSWWAGGLPYYSTFWWVITYWLLCVCETGINPPAPRSISFLGPTGPPSTLPLGTQTSSGSSTLSKKRPPPPPPGHKRTLSDPPSPLPHGPPNKGAIPWGKFS